MLNDMRYKVMFAVEIALLPLIISFKMLAGNWAVAIPLLLVALCRGLMIMLKNRASMIHHYIAVIGDTVVLGFLAIYFCVLNVIPLWLCILVCVLVAIYQVGNVYFYSKPMPDIIEALDFCFIAFIFTTLIALTFALYIDVVAQVSFIAIMLTSAVVVVYKVYRFLNYYIINRDSKLTKERVKAEKRKK